MNHHALQHAHVIALYDEEFVARAHAEPGPTLAPLGLGAEEQEALLAVDRRAWRTDPLRRLRTLRTLAEELKASTTLVLAETRRASLPLGFFSSPFFHRAIVERLALAPAFGNFLLDCVTRGEVRSPHAADVIRLETTRARSRRRQRRGRLAPGVLVVKVAANTLDAVQSLERYVFELGLMPQLALCADGPPPPSLPAPTAETAWLLLQPGTGDSVSLVPIDEPLFGVLEQLAGGGGQGLPARLIEALADEGLVAR